MAYVMSRPHVTILEFHDHIWNHHEKCTVISANMHSIGFEIPEIVFEMLGFVKKIEKFVPGKTNKLVKIGKICESTYKKRKHR